MAAGGCRWRGARVLRPPLSLDCVVWATVEGVAEDGATATAVSLSGGVGRASVLRSPHGPTAVLGT